ncbi:protein SFI1 homolog isoform X3 [Narcine bancroftii]|uniref:protein SFI1 homolog isoform X3 n=1 Tax=Narcine bancroftii TaxID=1343680 RepID=UPI00383219F2
MAGIGESRRDSKVMAVQLQLPASVSQEQSIKHDRCNEKRRFIPYRVNYTWNRGGRLKELRIRHLARKFLHLWMGQTFGRVLPSKARSHYCHALLNKVFDEWKEQWWCTHVEWKLMVRADCHYRYNTYSRLWRAWQLHNLQQQKKKSKFRIATSHARLQMLHKIWIQWSLYIKMRKVKHFMQVEAQMFHIKTLSRNVWFIWTKQLVRKGRNRAMDDLAMQYWAETLQHKALLQWNAMLHQLIKAQQTYWHQSLRRSFLAWLLYVQVRREKKCQRDVAEQRYTNNIVSQYFSSWNLNWHLQKSIHARETHISEMNRRCKLRRIFQHWNHYIVLRTKKTELCKLADHYYRRYLLQLSFVALKRNVGNVRLKQMQNNLAYQQSIMWMLQRCWNQWKINLEKQEELQIQTKSGEAQNHFRKVLLKKSLHYWMKCIQERKWYQVQDKKAKAHYRQMLLPFYLERWKFFVCEKKRLNELKETAWVFHREMVQRLAFYAWWKMMDQHCENRLAERLAVIHCARHMLFRYWCCWRMQTAICMEQREKETTAEIFFRHQLLVKFIRFWREAMAEQKSGQDKEIQALRYQYKICLRRTWSAWHQYVQKKHERRKKQMCADTHFHQVLLCKSLNRWKVYLQNSRQILYKVEEKENKWKSNLLRFSFSTWKQNAHALADEARKAARVDHHFNSVLLSKVFGCWRDVTSIQVYQRLQKDKVVLEAKQHIEFVTKCPAQISMMNVHLQHVFSHWKRLSKLAVTQRGKLVAASQHYGLKIIKKCLMSWKLYHGHCLRIMLLQRQGQWFQAYRLNRCYFTDWKLKLLDKRREDKETAVSLWHWSLSLQGKKNPSNCMRLKMTLSISFQFPNFKICHLPRNVFDAWLMYVKEQQRKKSRIAKAVENYQSHLLRTGVAAILQFTSDMMQLRNHIAAEHQVKTAYSLHQIVYHYAMVWKQRTLCKRESSKQKSVAMTRKKNVAFKHPIADVCKEKDVFSKTGILKSSSSKMITKATTDPVQFDSSPKVLPGSDVDFRNLHIAHQMRLQPRKPRFLLKPSQKKEVEGNGNNRGSALTLGSSMPIPTSLSPIKVKTPTQSKAYEIRDHIGQRDDFEHLSAGHIAWQPKAENLQSHQSQMALSIARFVPSWPTVDNLQEQPVPENVLLPPSAFLSLAKEKVNANEDVNRSNMFGASEVQKDKGVLTKQSHATGQLPSADHLSDRTELPSLNLHVADTVLNECNQQRQLEAELREIRQQMQSFHDRKQKLRIWRKQASVLQNWLQVNGREEGKEVSQMRQELKQLDMDIEILSVKLRRDEPHMQFQVARVQEIRELLAV